MATLAAIKTSYDQLARQSNDLFIRVDRSSDDQRITFEEEVNSLDFAIMKLTKLIKKNPSAHAECKVQIDLDALQKRVLDINKLIYQTPVENPLTEVALNAFAYGAISGAVFSQLSNGIMDQKVDSTAKSEDADLVILGSQHFTCGGGKMNFLKNPILKQLESVVNQVGGKHASTVWEVLKDLTVSMLKYLLDNPNVAKALIKLIVELLSSGKNTEEITKAANQFMQKYV